jgi:hypothetical protein
MRSPPRQVIRTAREPGIEVAAHSLGAVTRSDQLGSLPAFAPERLAMTAPFFLDLAVVPFLLRALFEVNPKTLQAEIGPQANEYGRIRVRDLCLKRVVNDPRSD